MRFASLLRPSKLAAGAGHSTAKPGAPAWHGLAACIVLLGLNVVLFPKHWMGLTSFTYDFVMHYYAVVAYWMSSVVAGEWPHWVPYQALGYPLAMNLQSGIYYPPFWIFPIAGIPYDFHAANIFQILHVYAGALGMYCLARTHFKSTFMGLLAAVCYHLYGGFFTNAEHPDIIRSFSLLPWLFWAFLLDEGSEILIHIKGFSYKSRLLYRNLLIPPLLYLFIVGGYPGCMIAGMLCLFVFVLVQTVVANVRRQGIGAFLDAAALGGLTVIGIGMAAIYLLPGFRLSGELVRADMTQSLLRWYLNPTQLGSLFYTSVGLGPDISMIGMQIPVVVAVFLPFVRRSDLIRHCPFLVVGAVAAVMCISSLEPISSTLMAILPPLSYSRFPAGDYRTLLYMAVLFLALSGVNNLRRSPEPLSLRHLVILAAAAAVVLVGGILYLALAIPDAAAAAFAFALLLQVATLAMMLAVLAALVRMRRMPARQRLAFSLMVPMLAVVGAWPVLDSMSSFWKTPLPINVYQWNGVPDRLGNELHSASIFRQHLTERPARLPAPHPHNLSWRGYLTGEFMITDLTGSQSKSQAAVERNMALQNFMMQPSGFLAFDCAQIACDQREINGLDMNSTAEAVDVTLRTLSFARNSIVHEINLPRRMLVVENETFAPGWTAKINGTGARLEPVRVDGALRGWVLPAGHYKLSTSYQTPLMQSGAGISLAMLVAWLLVIGLYAHARRSARTALSPAMARTAAA